MITSTTVLGILKDGKAVIGADGQVTFGDTVLKHKAKKVTKIYNDEVLVGFAGSVADAYTLFENLEKSLKEYKGDILRASVELARRWRTDKFLRRLEALLAVLNREKALIISGGGEVVEPEYGIVAIGSGAAYARAAAYALLKNTNLSPREIVEESLKIAAEICIYTNENFTILEL
ncbi:MAG: ATP-dependent protease subunit HslV [Candidatus Hydrothermales bacterium]